MDDILLEPLSHRKSSMQTSKNQVFLYNTRDEIEYKSAPYAIEDAGELALVISHFFAWARILPKYPDVAAKCGTAHIQLATDLRSALKASHSHHLYPNVVLPVRTYLSAQLLRASSQTLGPEIAELIEQETQRWAEEFPALGVGGVGNEKVDGDLSEANHCP
jgi:hypothetical protein